MKLMIKTGGNADVEKAVIATSMKLGFKEAYPYKGTGMGYYGLSYRDDKLTAWIVSQYEWERHSASEDRIKFDATVGSIATLVSIMRKCLPPEDILLPFQIAGYDVRIIPKKYIKIGTCTTLTPGQIREIMNIYCPDAGLQCPSGAAPG